MLYNYNDYLKILDDNINKKTKSKKRNEKRNEKKKNEVKKVKCCKEQNIIKGTCENCGLVIEEIIYDTEDVDNCYINYNKDVSATILYGSSIHFNSIKRLHIWKGISYNARTLLNDIKPLIEIILKNYNTTNDLKMINKTYLLYKNYFSSDNVRRRGNVKIALIILIIYKVFTYYENKNGYNINYKYFIKNTNELLIEKKIIKTNIKKNNFIYLMKNIEKTERFYLKKLINIL